MASLLSVRFCGATQIIPENVRLAFLFSALVRKGCPCSRAIHRGEEGGEILAQRPPVELGGPKDKISEPS
jgi:hypothetical protein